MAAGFRTAQAEGDHFVNRGTRDALLVEIGDRTPADEVDDSDIGMMVRWGDGDERYLRKDATAY